MPTLSINHLNIISMVMLLMGKNGALDNSGKHVFVQLRGRGEWTGLVFELRVSCGCPMWGMGLG